MDLIASAAINPNSAEGTESGGGEAQLPMCTTCHQKARSMDKYAKDTQILKWSKCDPDKDSVDGVAQKLMFSMYSLQQHFELIIILYYYMYI